VTFDTGKIAITGIFFEIRRRYVVYQNVGIAAAIDPVGLFFPSISSLSKDFAYRPVTRVRREASS